MPRARIVSDAEILDACRRTFLDAGLNAPTRLLAESAGVSEGVLFQRFRTKNELFFAAMRMPPPDLDAVGARALKLKSPKRALMLIAEGTLAYLRANMPAVLLVLAHPDFRGGSGPISARAHELLLDARSLFEAFDRVMIHLDSEHRTTARQRKALADMLVSTLLARAIHEQIGVADPSEGVDWLSDIVSIVTRTLAPVQSRDV